MEPTFSCLSGGRGRGPPPGREIECRSLRPADYPAVKEIIAESFPQALQANPKVLESLEQEPWYDPSHLFVAVVEGRPVSHMGVRDGLLWCSGVGVAAGLVGAVCTAPPLRGRGIGAQLMRASFCTMEQNGLAISCLHTSPERYGFYSRLGYRKAIIESPRLLLNLDSDKPGLDLDSGRPVITRTATAADAGVLHGIHAAHYSQVSGSWSRTVPFWERRLLQEPKLFGIKPLVFRVAPGQPPAAYVALLEGKAGTVSEWGCLPGAEDIAAGLLSSTLREWRNRGVREAELTLSTCHPLRPRIESMCDDRSGHGDIWVRVQNRGLFVEQITPLLDARATAAGLRVKVRFSGGGGALELGRGEPLQLEIEDGDLLSLVYNGRRLPALMEECGISAVPEDRGALSELFPDTGAARCAQDAY